MRDKQQVEQFEAAKQRCAELMGQRYWERHGEHNTQYNSTGFFSVLKIVELTPAWWSSLQPDGMGNARCVNPELKIGGHVELLWLPLLPTLVKTGKIDPKARGPVGAIPRHTALKVKRVTCKHAPGTVESWFSYADNLVVPLTVTAAPVLCFSEPLSYFDGLRPSTPERFEAALQLVLRFVRGAQELLPEALTAVS